MASSIGKLASQFVATSVVVNHRAPKCMTELRAESFTHKTAKSNGTCLPYADTCWTSSGVTPGLNPQQ
jgi:hypothetical protein